MSWVEKNRKNNYRGGDDYSGLESNNYCVKKAKYAGFFIAMIFQPAIKLIDIGNCCHIMCNCIVYVLTAQYLLGLISYIYGYIAFYFDAG